MKMEMATLKYFWKGSILLEWWKGQGMDLMGLEPKILYLFIFLIIQYSQMSEQEQKLSQQAKKQGKTANRWTNISSDDDESASEQSQKQQKAVPEPKKQQAVVPQPAPAREEGRKREHNIVPFDAKKKFRGEFANIKTVKGGFKAQKLEAKKFRLDTVKNPFAFAEDSSDDEKQAEAPVTEAPAQQEVKEAEVVEKKTKKSKKQQDKEDLQELLKQLNAGKEEEGDAKKKKKVKKPKKQKVQGEQSKEVKAEQVKAEEVKTEQQPVEEFTVDRESIEQVLKKKALEAAKNKKTAKVSVAGNARRAIEEREAKNKGKKVYVDL